MLVNKNDRSPLTLHPHNRSQWGPTILVTNILKNILSYVLQNKGSYTGLKYQEGDGMTGLTIYVYG